MNDFEARGQRVANDTRAPVHVRRRSPMVARVLRGPDRLALWAVVVGLLLAALAAATADDAHAFHEQAGLPTIVSPLQPPSLSVGIPTPPVELPVQPPAVAIGGPPAPPANVRVTNQGDGFLEIAWDESTQPGLNRKCSGRTEYMLYVDGKWVGGVCGSSHRITNLANARSYQIQMAVWSDGPVARVSARTAAVTGTPVGDPPLPAPDRTQPSSPVVSVTSTKGAISLTWAASTDNVGVVAYQVWRRNPEGMWTDMTYRTQALALEDAGVVEGGSYLYDVYAIDAAGNYSARGRVGATASSPPTAPANLRVTGQGDGYVEIAWDASTEPNLNRKCDGSPEYMLYLDGEWDGGVCGTSYRIPELANGRAYAIQMAVWSADPNARVSPRTAPVTGIPVADPTPPTPAPGEGGRPAPPQNLRISGQGDGSLDIAWDASTEPNLNRKCNGDAEYMLYVDGRWVGGVCGTSHKITGLDGGRSYAVQMAVWNGEEPAQRSERTASVVGTTSGTATAPRPPVTLPPTSDPKPKPGGLFAADSYVNRPLADNEPIDPNSDKYLAHFLPQLKRDSNGRRRAWINIQEYSTPLYVVGADVPTKRVQVVNRDEQRTNKSFPALQAMWERVPIPSHANPSQGRDGHMTIWQPSSDTLWEFTYAQKRDSGEWVAHYGGRIQNVSRHPGYYEEPPRGPGKLFGATASSIPVSMGLITGEDVRSGVIDHALAFAIPDQHGSKYRWPAQRPEKYSGSSDQWANPQGLRYRLPPDLDIDNLDAPESTKMIARAVQKYGMVLRDHGGSVVFFAEDKQTGGNYDIGDRNVTGFPWEKLQALDESAR